MAVFGLAGLSDHGDCRAAPDGSAIVNDARYLYAGVATVLMAFAVVVAKSRPPRLVTAAVLPLALIGLLVNAITLRQDAAAARNQADSVRAYIGALEIARPVLRPTFGLTDVSPNQDVSALIGSFEASPFEKAAGRIGNEPVDLKALPRLSPDRRQVVDDVLARALGLHLAAPAPPPAHEQCTTIEGGMGRELRLPRNGLDLGVGPQPADVFVRRYADAPAQRLLGSLSPGQAASLVAPSDRSRLPWFVRVVSGSPVRACGAR